MSRLAPVVSLWATLFFPTITPVVAQTPVDGERYPADQRADDGFNGSFDSSGGGCVPMRPLCGHSCDHVGTGVNNCTRTGEACKRVKSEIVERKGNMVWKIIFYFGGRFGDSVNG